MGFNPTSEDRIRCSCNRSFAKWPPRCHYIVILVRKAGTNRWIVDGASVLTHNHGPAAKLLSNPQWRPPRRVSQSLLAAGSSVLVITDCDLNRLIPRSELTRPRAMLVLMRRLKRGRRSNSPPAIAASTMTTKHKTDQKDFSSSMMPAATFGGPSSLANPHKVSKSSVPAPMDTRAPSAAMQGSVSNSFTVVIERVLTAISSSLAPFTWKLIDAGIKDSETFNWFISLEDEAVCMLTEAWAYLPSLDSCFERVFEACVNLDGLSSLCPDVRLEVRSDAVSFVSIRLQ